MRKRGVSLGTTLMLICTVAVLAGFAALLPSFTGNQDILFDATRLAVAFDDSLSNLTATTAEIIKQNIEPQRTIKPPFTSQTSLQSTAKVPEPTPSPTPLPKRSFTLSAAGSVELNSSVLKSLTFSKTERYDLLTDHIQQQLKADLSILTLQNTISDSNKLSNVNMPAAILPALRRTGVNTISVAHKNMLNYGMDGLNETMKAVQQAGFTSSGTQNPTSFDLNGIHVALFHYQDHLSATGQKQTAPSDRESVLSPIDLSAITADIEKARSTGTEVVIVTLYWGEAGKHEPSDEQFVQAQAIADAGADIILGTGNGALQPVRVLSANRGDGKYHPVLCAYSLGNLFSPERESRVTLASILLKTTVVYDPATQTIALENLAYTPTYAWRGKDEGQTTQRILINDPSNLPDFVDSNQKGVMERCYTLVTTVMENSAIPLSY